MHEASLAAPLLRLVLEQVERHSREMGQPLSVSTISIRAGLLQDIDARFMQGIFSLMAEGTAAASAVLEVAKAPMTGHCPDCGRDVHIDTRDFHCPICAGENVDWRGGNELYIEALKVQPVEDA